MTHFDNNPFKEIEDEVTRLHKENLENVNSIEEIKSENEKNLDQIFTDLLSVIDAFNKADNRMAEQYPDNEVADKVRKRFMTAKKKLIEILNKNGVEEILFPDGMATLRDCEITETEPNQDLPDNTIISINKSGYRRKDRLLRLAEVVTVKN